jgi:hypothetical protein
MVFEDFREREVWQFTDGLSSTTPSSTTARLESVLEQVSPVGVRRARVVIRLGVVVRTLVLVANEETDRGTESDSSFDTGLEVDLIGFITLE